jgi:hypothetical protein
VDALTARRIDGVNTDYRWFVQVFEDTNGNGVADAGDLGIAGVTVTLTFNGQQYTGTTDASGIFRTDWIRDPNWIVVITLPMSILRLRTSSGIDHSTKKTTATSICLGFPTTS